QVDAGAAIPWGESPQTPRLLRINKRNAGKPKGLEWTLLHSAKEVIPRPQIQLPFLLGVLLALHVPSTTVFAADTVEFLSGAKLKGIVTRIDKTKREITVEAEIAGRTVERTYSYDKIHAVEYRGKRYVLTEKPASPNASDAGRGRGGGSGRVVRSRTEVERLINNVGKSFPDWYDSTPLDFPKTLDLSWPEPPPKKGWRNQVNVGQYLWDIINPNPGRWHSGVRLVYHLLSMHNRDPKLRVRCMRRLGGMYFNFFQDYARAAYWWRQGGVRPGEPQSVALAECYFRLGNKNMAVDALDSRRLLPGMVKLFGDMGEARTALQIADTYVRVGGEPHQVYLLAGDAARQAGQHETAIQYYQKVLDAKPLKNKDYQTRTLGRARDSIEVIRLFELSDVKNVRDGTYRASSPAFTGPLEVEVQVANGRIASVKVVQHTEKQFYSALTETTQQILEKQSVKGIDTTSRATITSVAIINATAKALASGAK
ncbi:MAG: FMN-binding protein, partial [Pirellulaceae bacterium]